MIAGLSDHNVQKEERLLYRVQSGDIGRASKVLVDAFQHDPLWDKIYERESQLEKRLHVAFEASVGHYLKYGEVFAPRKIWGGYGGLLRETMLTWIYGACYAVEP